MNKAYERINWQNEPSTATKLNATNLNKMDLGLDTIDDRVIDLDTNKADASSIVTEISGLDDVNISSPTNNQVLKYDSTNDEWVNANESGGSVVSVTQKTSTGTNIADITVDGTTTQIFAPTSGGASSLSGLSDVNVSSMTDGQALVYDSTSSKWVNETISGGGGHTIQNDSGTDLTQREVLQAKGVYSHDDSTNQKTVIEVVREYNSESDIQALSGESAKGFQNLGNSLYYNKKLMNSLPEYSLAQYNALTNKPDYWVRNDAPSGDRGINAQDIAYDSNTSVKAEIDTKLGKEDSSSVIVDEDNNDYTLQVNAYGNVAMMRLQFKQQKTYNDWTYVKSWSYAVPFSLMALKTDDTSGNIYITANGVQARGGTYKQNSVYTQSFLIG